MVVVRATEAEVRRVAEEHLRDQVSVVRAEDGYLVLCHAQENGRVLAPRAVLDVVEAGQARLICCHPAAVRRANPALAHAVVGDWEGPTIVRSRISLRELRVFPE